MGRFKGYDNDDDYSDDFFPDTDQEMTEEEYAEMMEAQAQSEAQQLAMVRLDLNQRLLFKSMAFVKQSFWWKFRSHRARVRLLTETFKELKKAVSPPGVE